MLAVDTETKSLAYREGEPSVFMAQWADADGEYVCDENTGWQPFLDALAADDVLVLANASFDIHHLRASGIVDLLTSGHRLYDVQTLARVALPGRFQYKLEGLGSDLLGTDATEQQRALAAAAKEHGLAWTAKEKDYYALWKLEPELMERYGKEDVRLTYDLWQLVWARATQADASVYMFEAREVAPILRAAERDGVLVDKSVLAALKERLLAERMELRLKLLAQGMSEEALGDEDGGKKSSNALLEDLLRIGVPLYRKTPKSGEVNPKTGKRAPDKLAVNKDALKEFELRFPVVSDLIQWRSRNQILSTFVAAMEKADPRVHTSFRQAEARTSRMSSAQPNMQNLPRPGEEAENDELALGIRRVIIPAPGNALLVADYSGIEVMVMAHYIANDELSDALEAGKDLYAMNASRVYDLPYENCTKQGTPHGKAMRQRSKTTVLTCMYGGGAQLLSTRLGVPTVEAAAIKAETLSAIPGYWEFDDRVKRAVQRRSFPHVVTILGRRLYVPKDKPYVALNTIVQGTSAELMKLGMVAGARAVAPRGYATRLVVHDELVLEGPACNAEAALLALVPAMENVYPLRPRLKVEADWSTKSYADAK